MPCIGQVWLLLRFPGRQSRLYRYHSLIRAAPAQLADYFRQRTMQHQGPAAIGMILGGIVLTRPVAAVLLADQRRQILIAQCKGVFNRRFQLVLVDIPDDSPEHYFNWHRLVPYVKYTPTDALNLVWWWRRPN